MKGQRGFKYNRYFDGCEGRRYGGEIVLNLKKTQTLFLDLGGRFYTSQEIEDEIGEARRQEERDKVPYTQQELCECPALKKQEVVSTREGRVCGV